MVRGRVIFFEGAYGDSTPEARESLPFELRSPPTFQ